MARFPLVRQFDHPALEAEVQAFWQEARVFERSTEDRPGAPTFTFYEGPPTANGRPGIHHVMARAIKDIFCRYKTLKGFRVDRKAGWDTHGLPVEIEVEKELGLKSRADIEAYGIARYNAACRASVQRYTALWDRMTAQMGYWVDLEHPYVTFHNEYIESVWWLLRRLWDKGLLYQGYKIQWYSPGSGTVLSSHEVSLGYKEVQDPSVYVRFPVHGEADTAFLAWTTTPWTLPSNTALAVGAEIPYVKVRLEDSTYLILAERRLDVLKQDAEVVARMTGADLVGRRYDPPFDGFRNECGPEAAWRVVAADFVTDTDGTGVAHEAPAFGADDYNAVVLGEGMPLFNPVRPDGTFERDFGDAKVEGLSFKEADRVIIRDLRARGLLFREESYLHNYPHDWRKGTPLMQYPVESYFVRTTQYRDRLVELNQTIRWQPEGVGEGRFGEWLRGNVDWALSRRRYWGTPLPVWKSDGSDHAECIGSIAELTEKVGGTIPPEAVNPDTGALDLHRPYVDALTWPDPTTPGATMRRVPDLIDVWFDSGAMPFAQWHYPFENEQAFREHFPADFIAEAVDQTRGWFYTLHAIATLVEDSVAYKSVFVNGLLLDEKGEKMSKSKGNTVDPFAVMDRFGADVVRWAMMADAPPWESVRFSERRLEETRRKFFGTLENVYTFFATYANLDGFEAKGDVDAVALPPRADLDRWILSRLAATTETVEAALEDLNPTKAARAVEAFVDDLSNWYLRRSRRRFWKSDDPADKQAAYRTVHTCLRTVAVLMSPVAPFFADWLHRALGGDDSVHLAAFPEAGARDLDLERRMDLARSLASLVLGLRQEAGIGVRQPLPRAVVAGVDAAALAAVREVALDEVNLKALDVADEDAAFARRSAAANFRVLGKKAGPRMKAAAERIRAMTGAEIAAFVREGAITLDLPDGPLALSAEDVVVTTEGVEGWGVASEGGLTVALDTALTPALVAEGLARETVNRLQNLRKSAGLDVADRIHVRYAATPTLAAALESHAAYVRNETLALTFAPDLSETDPAEPFDLLGETLRVALVRA
jgi:isoleucyl-tRNA synthetase